MANNRSQFVKGYYNPISVKDQTVKFELPVTKLLFNSLILRFQGLASPNPFKSFAIFAKRKTEVNNQPLYHQMYKIYAATLLKLSPDTRWDVQSINNSSLSVYRIPFNLGLFRGEPWYLGGVCEMERTESYIVAVEVESEIAGLNFELEVEYDSNAMQIDPNLYKFYTKLI